ncbi:MAG: MFS transporter [Verrucomicrobiota bacterium]|nr:MFS transporter [Verrucomicrobiota bacterium]
MFRSLFNWFKAPPPVPRHSEDEIRRQYPLYRWRIFEASFIAYATFYIVRNNFSPVQMELGHAQGYDNIMLGGILSATAITYGIGKFVMGFFSDGSDPRKYLFVAMSLTALINFAFGSATNYHTHLFLWALNGFVQGMGYAPCTRGLAHWFSVKERGYIFGWWNISHNIGGAIAGVLAAWSAKNYQWPAAFYFPGVIAAFCAIYLFWRMRDTPQSVGLPSIEEFTNEYPPEELVHRERELTMREILIGHIFTNKWLWLIAFANFFVYIARYSMLDWGPTYLKEAKGATILKGGISTAIIELSGAAGMLSMGWISDKVGGRRGFVSMISMIPLLAAFSGLIFGNEILTWTNSIFKTAHSAKTVLTFDLVMFGILGFCVYVPVMMLGVMSLDLTSKKAVGTAAGFVGMFGYLGRVAQGMGIGWLAEYRSWNSALYAIFAATAMAIFLLAFTWNLRPKG